MVSSQTPRLTVSMTTLQVLQLQKAWTRTGKFANRSQFVKAAINAYAGEIIFNEVESMTEKAAYLYPDVPTVIK